MAATNAVVLTTEKADGNRNPSNHANYISNVWSSDIENNGNYDISCATSSKTPSINSPSSIEDAVDQLVASSEVQTLLDWYDAAIVLDTRSYGGVQGKAEGNGVAGTDDAVGYNVITEERVSAHELGHLYNARHDDFKNWDWLTSTIMMNPYADSCEGNDHHSFQNDEFSICAANVIRSYIEYQL